MSKDTAEKQYSPRKGLTIKEIPQSLIKLREMLQLPAFFNISSKAQKEPTFEMSLGSIAADLNILLEGDYNVEDLCSMLCEALTNSTKAGTVDSPQLLSSKLIAAKIEETENALNIEFAKLPAAKTADAKSVTMHNIFMLEHGCKICVDRNACVKSKKCLGREDGSGKQEVLH